MFLNCRLGPAGGFGSGAEPVFFVVPVLVLLGSDRGKMESIALINVVGVFCRLLCSLCRPPGRGKKRALGLLPEERKGGLKTGPAEPFQEAYFNAVNGVKKLLYKANPRRKNLVSNPVLDHLWGTYVER